MTSWCSNLISSINDDSQWIASIPFPSTEAKSINTIINIASNVPLEETFETHVDIVQLLGTLSLSLDAVIKEICNRYNYPTNAVFHFEGYNSIDDKEDLITAIKDAAFKHGTVLINQKAYNKSEEKVHYTSTLSCAHYGTINSKTTKVFKSNYVQACGSIIQQAHYATSIKNRSRNSTFQRAHTSDAHVKSSRTNTTKCQCSFQLSIFFDVTSSRWFLKKRVGSNSQEYQYHFNHIFVDPKYLTHKKNTLPPHVIEEINNMMETGIKVNAIGTMLQSRHKMNVSYQTLYNMRMKKVEDLLKLCSENPSGTPVNRLINIFKHTENVSFVYILHKKESGFVTFRRNRNESIQQYVDSVNLRESLGFSEQSIKDWRDELSLKDSNHILVAFAWAHDEELKSTEMYPEYLAADVTFGVNRERRELFLVAGIDGRHRVFTSFRCFIPSKQEHAYTWVINQAMPHLLSNNVLRYNQLVCTDNELSLNHAVRTSIDSPKPAFLHTKFRLDCYHFHKKVWYQKIVPVCTDTPEAKSVLRLLNNWIMSWFKRLESIEELNISHTLLIHYLDQKNMVIGTACAELTAKHITSIISHKEQLLHPYFKDVASFDFISDSIVESANNPLKNGIMGVSSAMEISNSGLQQVKSTAVKSMKEDVSSAQRINYTMTWSKSLTKDYLTDYAEGLSCSNFDRRVDYLKRYIGGHVWLVCHKHLFDEKYSSDNNSPHNKVTRFVRVRIVAIVNGFMTCSCCYDKRMLMPCVHICCVIDEISMYTPDLFHIRWWKHFYFLYKTKVSERNKSSYDHMKASLRHNREHHFSKHDGKYKGVPMKGTKFDTHLQSDGCPQLIMEEDIVYYTLIAVHNMQRQGIPLVYGSYKYVNYVDKSSTPALIYAEMTNISNVNVEYNVPTTSSQQDVQDMGAGSQVLSQLSEYRREGINDDDNPSSENRSVENEGLSFYNRIYSTFVDMVGKIKTDEQCQEAKEVLEKLSFKLSKDSMKEREFADGDITFLGEFAGERRPEKRYKSSYER